MSATRADILLGKNEPLLCAVLVHDVLVNVAFMAVFCRTVHSGALQPPPTSDGHAAVRVELEKRAEAARAARVLVFVKCWRCVRSNGRR